MADPPQAKGGQGPQAHEGGGDASAEWGGLEGQEPVEVYNPEVQAAKRLHADILE